VQGLPRLSVMPGLLSAPMLLALTAAPARAQDDGARLYMLVPDNTTITSVRLHQLHSNLGADTGEVAPNTLDTTLGVFQFVQTLNIGGAQSFVFLVVPASHIQANSELQSKSVTGLGDVQLGFVAGVYGTPALKAADYAAHRPGLAVNLLAKLFFPTGEYSAERSVNIGANRWAVRLGAPVVYAMGTRMADPHLTTIELLPTVTFFGANDDPYGAGRSWQKPLFILEGHVTRGFTPRFWGSFDLLWREGGEMQVDRVDAGNAQSALSLGATGTFAVGRNMSLRLSGGGVVARNQYGPNGWMLRTIFGVVF